MRLYGSLSLHVGISHLLALGSGLEVLLLLVTRMLGPEIAGAFGFAKTIAEQVRRYLPADLFASLIRPKLVADFTADKDFDLLNKRAVRTPEQ